MNTPLESATRDHIAAAIAEIISAAVAEIAENRAVIDQAKGMLIVLYGVDDQTAFDTLRRHSQNTNIKLRALAEQLVSDYRALIPGFMHTSLRVTGVLSGVESSVVLGLGFCGWASAEAVHEPAGVVPRSPTPT